MPRFVRDVEFRMLDRRVDEMDQHGTRGIGALQQTIIDLVGRFGEMKSEFEAHEKQHRDDIKARANNRRWLIGTMISIGGLLVAILSLAVYNYMSIKGH